jgi:hypothetical protein
MKLKYKSSMHRDQIYVIYKYMCSNHWRTEAYMPYLVKRWEDLSIKKRKKKKEEEEGWEDLSKFTSPQIGSSSKFNAKRTKVIINWPQGEFNITIL